MVLGPTKLTLGLHWSGDKSAGTGDGDVDVGESRRAALVEGARVVRVDNRDQTQRMDARRRGEERGGEGRVGADEDVRGW